MVSSRWEGMRGNEPYRARGGRFRRVYPRDGVLLARSFVSLDGLQTQRRARLSDDPRSGSASHRDDRLLLLLVIGSTLAPALFAAFLGSWNGPAWFGGLVLGGLAGLASAALLPLYGTISACVRAGIAPPTGPFGIGWGRPTPGSVLAGHMIYGTVVAAILTGF
jgi:hypothetical protein